MNLRTTRMQNSWPMRIAPVHSQVGEECACYDESRLSGCERPVEETEECAARLQSYHSFLHNSFVCEACLMRYAYA